MVWRDVIWRVFQKLLAILDIVEDHNLGSFLTSIDPNNLEFVKTCLTLLCKIRMLSIELDKPAQIESQFFRKENNISIIFAKYLLLYNMLSTKGEFHQPHELVCPFVIVFFLLVCLNLFFSLSNMPTILDALKFLGIYSLALLCISQIF